MAEFDRRSFFGASFGMAAAAAMPEWLMRALAIQEPVSTWRTQQLRATIGRARKAEKPLLVLVVPDQNDKDVRGHWFGALLTSWDDGSSWLLASCELACATTAELGQVGGLKVEGAPLFVFADAGKEGTNLIARLTPIECVLPIVPIVPSGQKSSRLAADKARREGLQAMRPALLAGAERHGLSLQSVAAVAARRLEEAQRQAIDQAVQAHLVEQPIVGARWSVIACAGGFVHPTKAEVEAARKEEEAFEKALTALMEGKMTQEEFDKGYGRHMIHCGIAYVGDVSSRFLEFWTAGD